jgi:hypothetical protein
MLISSLIRMKSFEFILNLLGYHDLLWPAGIIFEPLTGNSSTISPVAKPTT